MCDLEEVKRKCLGFDKDEWKMQVEQKLKLRTYATYIACVYADLIMFA